MKLFNLSLLLFANVLLAQSNQQWHMTKLETVNLYRQLNGEIEAVNKATVSAQTSGRVEKLYYDVDDFVAKGSILVEFTNTEQKSILNQAQANASAAKIAFNQAEIDYHRIKDVYAKKLVAKSQLDQSLSNRNALQAKSIAAESAIIAAKKQLEYTVIRAPYDGILTNRYVEVGEVVNPGTAIMEGLSLSQLRVITHIPEKIIHQVKTNPTATIILNDGTEIIAKNITIFPYADKTTRTFKTRLDLDLTNTQLFPGMTVKVKIKVGESTRILVPISTIVTRSELTLVYVLQDEKIIPRQVKTGSRQGKRIEIISGLDINEKIIISAL